MHDTVLIFGYNDYTYHIVKQVQHLYRSIYIFTLTTDDRDRAIHDGLDARLFDLSDEWNELEKIDQMDQIICYCALASNDQNTFLTLSLHATFPKLFIVALANDLESANKLKIAGASKVIPIAQTTSDIIVDTLEKPVLTNILHNILYQDTPLQLGQVSIESNSTLIGLKHHTIAWQKYSKILLFSLVHDNASFDYIFTTKGYNHLLTQGDILVVIGYTDDITLFEKEVNDERINWSHRCW